MAVFHLKYRPQKIGDLDLSDVAEVLKNILSSKDMPQSFLFTGPKGAGKTSAARIVARAVNCLDPKGIEPCGKCDNCEEILKGSSLDIIEIDAASNRGIEDIRLLKDKAYLLPSKLNKKVFIIDEVHMLTKEAFNALLKLIEEPPKHTIFILCTTDAEKIPDTVLSRLTRVDFHKGNKRELKKSLQKIIEGEKVNIDSKTVDLVIEKSDGSFRNLQRTFNEIYLQLGKDLNIDKVTEFFNKKGGDYEIETLESDLANKDVKVILEKLENMAENGVDFGNYRQRLLDFFQKRLLSFYGVGESNIKSKLELIELEQWINLLIKAGKQEKDVEIDQLPLELAVVEFVGDKKKVINKEEIVEPEVEVEEKEEPKTDSGLMVVGKIELQKVEEKWGELLLAVKPFNHSVEAFLRSARPKRVEGDRIVLEVFYPFHKDRLEETKNRQIVEKGLVKVFGVDLGMECVLGKNKKEPLVIKNDTPVEKISDQLTASDGQVGKQDIYEVAKEIFG